jgi:hypothetical protein
MPSTGNGRPTPRWVRLEGDAPVAVAPPAERGAFVRQGGLGGAERKFDTLAEAVQNARDGDTIEVRGNGPFATESLRIPAPLTIRAGHGFRPVIRLSPEVLYNHDALVADAPLALEGPSPWLIFNPADSS